MALNTESKRRAVTGYTGGMILPLVDGVDSAGDRAHVAGLYPGSFLDLVQEGFRWRNDDGSETTATWRDNQDVNSAIDINANTRLRVLVDSTGDPPAGQYQLEYRKVGDSAWIKIE